MRLKAKDTLHVSSVQADNILPGAAFDVGDDEGKILVKQGLASEVGAKAEKAAPENKMEVAPANKAERPPLSALNVPVKAKGRF